MRKTRARFLAWLGRFLEVYARERMEGEIERLHQHIQEQDATIREQKAYIAGLERATRMRHITINNGVK